MGKSMSELGSWDLFFYYGQNDLDLEIESDTMGIVIQPPRSLFYNNKDSGGIAAYENYPNDLNLQVNGRYDIANAIAWKNGQVANGTEGMPDRRIAVSQNSISFKRKGGELDIQVFYIPFYNYTQYKTLSPTIPGVR